MPNILKYDSKTRVEIIRLAVDEHKSYYEISRLLGIHRNTLSRWLDRYKIRDLIDELKAEKYKVAIETGLSKLAAGAKTSEVTKEYLTEDEFGQPIKVTEKLREQAPDPKAIQILAQKYEKIYSDGKVTDKGNAAHLSININNSGMTLRELQTDKEQRIVDAEYSEVVKEEEGEDLGPPREDLNEK